MKFDRVVWALTAVALLVMAGCFFARRQDASGQWNVEVQRNDSSVSVSLAEDGWPDSLLEGEVIDDYLQSLFLPFRHCSVEYIVLGCTHYPFVRSAIRKNFGRPVEIIDGSDGTARQLKRQLEAAGLLTAREAPGQVTFLNSRPEMLETCRTLYNLEY